MVRANDNLAILSAEAPINQPLLTDGAAFVALEEEFRQAFEMTVVDMPRNMLINFPHLLAEMNCVVLATELTLASARDAIRILSWLKTNAEHCQVIVVANRVLPQGTEISKADFESSIERDVDFAIPYDAKSAMNAAKLGKTFVDANSSVKAAGIIKQIADRVRVSATEEIEAVKKDEKKSFFQSLLAPKQAKPKDKSAKGKSKDKPKASKLTLKADA